MPKKSKKTGIETAGSQAGKGGGVGMKRTMILLFCTPLLFIPAAISFGGGVPEDVVVIRHYLSTAGLAQTTKLISDRMAMSMPMQIDTFTQLSKVIYQYPSTIIVFARVSLSRQQIEELSSLDEIQENMHRDTVAKVCGNPMMETMLEAGMTIQYSYSDDRRDSLFTVSAHGADCI